MRSIVQKPNFIKYFLTVFLPSICLVASLLFYVVSEERKHQMIHTGLEASGFIKSKQKNVSDNLHSVTTDLLTLAKLHEVEDSISSKVASSALIHDLLIFSAGKRIYDQIRYLDESGQEVVRVNFNNGKPVVVPEKDLQNKADRYYFRDTFALARNEVFVSPLDLNIEHGEIEQPLKPMIRIGTPLFDINGKKRGIILLNYFGAELLDTFGQMYSDAGGEHMLLNSDGFWLKSNDPKDEWGFMYDDKHELTYANRFPDAWKQMQDMEAGQFSFQGGLVSFSTIYPIVIAEKNSLTSSTGSGVPFEASKTSRHGTSYFWKIVHFDEAESLEDLLLAHSNVPFLAIVLFIFMAIVSWIAAAAMARRQAALKELKVSLTRLKGFDQYSSEGVYRIDMGKPVPLTLPSVKILEWINKNAVVGEVNDSLARMYGLEPKDMIGKPVTDFAPDYGRRAVMMLGNDGYVNVNEETEDIDKDGHPLYLIESYYGIVEDGYLLEMWGAQNNITKRKKAELENTRLESQLRQAHKMEAIGTLAGGIAHDFNNILGIIIGYTDMAKEDAPPGSHFGQDLDKVLQASNRAKDLVKQILTFSRQAQVERVPLQPRLIIKEALKMLRSSIPTTIEIQENISQDLGSIDADPTQFHQIVVNLCTNAFHAMEENGGVLRVALQLADSVPPELQERQTENGERFLEMSISDTGHGIGSDLIEKIFDPFFTTKEQGKGTGMGLAISYGIVKEYGGLITVDSRVGEGATFHVYLPESRHDSVADLSDEKTVQQGSERILFVDDEEPMTEMGKDMLERLGYHVTAKQRSVEALEIFQEQPDKFDLVITDQTMPGLTGLDLSKKLLQIRPDIPIILCTGYSSQVDEEVAKSHGIKGFSFKPIAKNTIADLIRKVLDGG